MKGTKEKEKKSLKSCKIYMATRKERRNEKRGKENKGKERKKKRKRESSNYLFKRNQKKWKRKAYHFKKQI